MDQHVVDWEKELSSDGTHTNGWKQEIVRAVTDDARRVELLARSSKPEAFHGSEWKPTAETARGRIALEQAKSVKAHNANIAAQRPFDRLLFLLIVGAILALGIWGAELKRTERLAGQHRATTPFMQCAELPSNREKMDCFDREGLLDDSKDPVDGADDPRNEPRRR